MANIWDGINIEIAAGQEERDWQNTKEMYSEERGILSKLEMIEMYVIIKNYVESGKVLRKSSEIITLITNLYQNREKENLADTNLLSELYDIISIDYIGQTSEMQKMRDVSGVLQCGLKYICCSDSRQQISNYLQNIKSNLLKSDVLPLMLKKITQDFRKMGVDIKFMPIVENTAPEDVTGVIDSRAIAPLEFSFNGTSVMASENSYDEEHASIEPVTPTKPDTPRPAPL